MARRRVAEVLQPHPTQQAQQLGQAGQRAHLAPSMKALAAVSRSCFRPLRLSMMLRPWMQAAVLSISATS